MLWLAIAGLTAVGACGEEHPPPPASIDHATSSSSSSGDDDFDAGIPDGPVPCPDATGLCACEEVDVVQDIPNLYFVLDSSGSMNTLVTPDKNRYDLVREAAVDMVRRLGHLIRVGATLFPSFDGQGTECTPGDEVFPVTAGDPFGVGEGPVTQAFREAITVTPVGGTPTAATLDELAVSLSLLPGKTFILLATDGGPNCNDDITCDASGCLLNLDHYPGCDATVNCCDPAGGGTWSNCIDSAASIAAMIKLANADVLTYVIGIPGSASYESTLSAMADAGGAPPPPGSTKPYYQVDDLDTLGDVFSEIASIAISCDFDLGTKLEDPSLVNVYIDGELLPHEPLDNWDWNGETGISLRGATCTALKLGQIGKVQIVAGCPTEGPK